MALTQFDPSDQSSEQVYELFTSFHKSSNVNVKAFEPKITAHLKFKVDKVKKLLNHNIKLLDVNVKLF